MIYLYEEYNFPITVNLSNKMSHLIFIYLVGNNIPLTKFYTTHKQYYITLIIIPGFFQ